MMYSADERAALQRANQIKTRARKQAQKARPKNQKATRGRVEDPPYLAELRRRSCVVGPINGTRCAGRTDPAHIRYSHAKVGRVNPGMQRRSDDVWCLPVCRKHHAEQHAYGNEAGWWAIEVGVDPNDLALAYHHDWEDGGDGSAVMRRFTPTVRP